MPKIQAMRFGPFPFTGLLRGILLLLLPFTTTAQPSESRRLSTLPDSNAINTQIEIAQQLRHSKPDSTLSLLLEALHQSRRSGFGRGVRNALLNLAQLHYFGSRYEDCIKSARLLRQNSDSTLQSLNFYYAYHFEGLSFHAMDRYDSAINAYFRALHFIPDSFAKAIGIYCNIGELYNRMGERESAMKYFKRGIQWYKQHQPKEKDAYSDLAGIYNNIGLLHSYNNNFKEADSAFRQARQINESQEDFIGLYNSLRLQAALYNAMGMPDKALAVILQAKNLVARHTIPYQRNAPYQLDMQSGEAYFQLGRYPLAEQRLMAALQQIDSLNISGRATIYRKLSRIYERDRKYQEAYSAVLTADSLDAQVKNKEIQSRLNEANIRYQTAEKDAELARKNAQLSNYQRNTARKNLLIASTSLGLIIVLLLLWNARRHYQRRQQLLQQEKELGQLKAIMTGEEKERVRLARELHDGIGSMLATIKLNVGSIQHINKDAAVSTRLHTVAAMLQETSSEVRTTAHNLVPDALSKYDIREVLLQYIQKLNDTHDIRITLHMPVPLPALSKTVELVLYRMVQELVQNVIKHASATHIAIQLLAYDDQISLSVEDNGKGIASLGGATPGFGLDNLRYRVHALHGEMDIDSRPGSGTTVHISFNPEQLG